MSKEDVDDHVDPPECTEEKDLCLICKHCLTWWTNYFWSKDSNPLDSETIASLQRQMWSKKNFWSYGDHGNKDEKGHTINDQKEWTPQERVADHLESIASSIRNQVIRTRAEWEEKKETFKCPKCGKQPQLCDRWDW